MGKERASSDVGEVADRTVVDEYVVAAEERGVLSTLSSMDIAMSADTVR